MVTQKSVHPPGCVRMQFADEMLQWGNKFVGMLMVYCIKFGINMASFICQFLEAFCFSSADLKSNKPICSAVYRGPEPDIFLNLRTTRQAPKHRLFRLFQKLSLILRRPFYPICDRNMANFKNPSKYSCTAFRLICSGQPRCLIPPYRVVTPALFAQISLSLLLNLSFVHLSSSISGIYPCFLFTMPSE